MNDGKRIRANRGMDGCPPPTSIFSRVGTKFGIFPCDGRHVQGKRNMKPFRRLPAHARA